MRLHSMALELTARCNQRCTYCYNAWRGRGDEARGQTDLSTSEWTCLIDRVLAEAELGTVTLTGGEPFLRGDLFALIDHLNGRGLPVSIISNGGVLGDTAVAQLADREVHYVQLTFAGPDAAAHDGLCGSGAFARTVAAVERLVSRGVGASGSFLCTSGSFARAGETLELMRRLGVSHIAFNRFNPSGYGLRALSSLLPTRSQTLISLRLAEEFAAKWEQTIHSTMPIPACMIDERDFPHVRFGQCAVGTDQAEYAVGPRGELRLCTVQRRAVGSLRRAGLQELLASDPAKSFRSMIPAFCVECPRHDTCLGGCGAAADWAFGRYDQLDPFIAQHIVVDLAGRVRHNGNSG